MTMDGQYIVVVLSLECKWKNKTLGDEKVFTCKYVAIYFEIIKPTFKSLKVDAF